MKINSRSADRSHVNASTFQGTVLEPDLYGNVLNSLQTGVYVADRAGKILICNQGAERIAGFMSHEVIGRRCCENILAQCNHQACVTCAGHCPFALALQDGKPREARMQLRHKQGYPVPVMLRVAAFRDSHGSIRGIVASFDEQRFATDRDRQQYNLAAYGCMDEITGIPNHGFTQFHLRENLAGFAEYHVPFGVLFIEVEHLDHFCSSYGHQAGDAILRLVGQTMRNSLRPGDFLGRWSGDQFLAILPNCGAARVEHAAARVRKIVDYAGLQWWGDRLTVSTAIGLATAQVGDTMDSLLQRAQQSLRQVFSQETAAPNGADSTAKS